jgi:excisionase family DNA binding protein
MQQVSIDEAARLLGVSQDTIRRRIRNGELKAHQETRPQGYIWRVTLPDEEPESEGQNHVCDTCLSSDLVEALRNTIQRQDDAIAQLRTQLEAKDRQLETRGREVQELHVLLQQAQAALAAPKENHQSWWRRLWQRQR